MTENKTREALCAYRLTENRIHEFVFHEPTRAAVDAWMTHLDELYNTVSQETVFRTMIDTTAGMLPLAYSSQRLKAYFAAHPQRTRTKLASLQPPGMMMAMVRSMVGLLTRGNNDTVRLFAHDERDKAIAWLLADE